MIVVILDGHEFENEARDVIRLFFPEGEICIAHGNPGDSVSGILFYTSVKKDGAGTMVSCGIKTGEYERTVSAPASASYPPVDMKSKKTVKWELKRQLYHLLSEYTGSEQPWGMLTGIRPAKIVHEMLDNNADFSEIWDFLGNYCRVSDEKIELVRKVTETQRKIFDITADNMISLYIGIPFCKTRCLYCSFISDTVARCSHLLERYMQALRHELEGIGRIIEKKGLVLQNIYIGGGPPTSIGASLLDELLVHIGKVFNLDELMEFTLEAGRPDSINESILDVVRKSRVNRISINPQSMNDETLRTIGRNHTAKEVERAFFLAREMGFNNINMDVIAGLPGETIGHFRYTMDKIAELGPESLTVHTLSIKRGSELHERKVDFASLDAEAAEAMVEEGRRYAELMGMHPYYLYRQKYILGNLENTGYCKPGYESIYNVQIMEERQTIIAAGANGVTKAYFPSENRIERAFNVKNPEEYIKRIDEMLGRKEAILS